MSLEPIASEISQPRPLDGQSNRSSPQKDFEFSQVPDGTILVKIRDNNDDTDVGKKISCAVMWDRPAQLDEVITTVHHLSEFRDDRIQRGNQFYLAAPNGADAAFTVTFYRQF
jgi:hypothetical protein